MHGVFPGRSPGLRWPRGGVRDISPRRVTVRIGGESIPDAVSRRSRAAQLVKVLALADRHQLLEEQAMGLL
jgi:hypothetical protein